MKEAMKLEGFATDHPMIMFEMLDSDGSGKVLSGSGVRTQRRPLHPLVLLAPAASLRQVLALAAAPIHCLLLALCFSPSVGSACSCCSHSVLAACPCCCSH